MLAGNPSPARSLIMTLVAVAIVLAFMLPIVWMLTSSLRPNAEIFRYLSPLSWRAIAPEEWTAENYQLLFAGAFQRALLNSILVSLLTVAIGLLLNAMAAYALSVLKFRFREIVFTIVVISFLIPFEGVAIPLTFLARSWGLQNSFAGLILPGVANGLSIFLLRQFFLGIPEELREAARMDGAGWWLIFWRIYLPLSKPALVGAGLILFMFQWQAYLWPLLIVSESRMDLAPVALGKLLGQFDFEFGQMFAGAVAVSLIPALILLPLQRFFEQTIKSSGGKE